MITKRRKRFNRMVQLLAELYDRNYNEVYKIYLKQEQNIESTRIILNLM